MDDIIHSAPQRQWVISLIVLAALLVFPQVVHRSLLFLRAAYVLLTDIIFFVCMYWNIRVQRLVLHLECATPLPVELVIS